MTNDSHYRLFSRNPLFHLMAALAAGIVFASGCQIKLNYLISGLAITTLTVLFAALMERRAIAGISLLTAIFFAGSVLTILESRVPAHRVRNLIDRAIVDPSQPVNVTGTVTGPVELAREGIHFSLNVYTVETASQSIKSSGVVAFNGYFKTSDEEAKYRQLDLISGARITVRTRLDRTEQYRNPGVSTLAEYLDTKDLDAIATLRGPQSIVRAASSGRGISTLLYQWRNFLQREIDSHFSNETAGVLAAALLGNRYNLSTGSAQRFREGGTFHLLVISGAHITFLGTIILIIARRLTTRRWLQLVASAFIVWLYTFAVGADASVVRAALMFSFVAFGLMMFRKSSPLNSVSAAALVLLISSPRELFDPALQLTFLSVLAIVSLAMPVLHNLRLIGFWRPTRSRPYPPECSRSLRVVAEALYWSENEWQREQKKLNYTYRPFKTPLAQWLERHRLQRLVRYLFASAIVSVAVQLMLLPLQVMYFHRLSPSSLVLNVVVGILLTVLAAVALVAVLIAQVSVSVAMPLMAVANFIDWLMVHSVDPFTGFGLASWRLPEYVGVWRVIYVLYYLPLIGLSFSLARWQPIRSRRSRQGRDRSRRQGQAVVLLCFQMMMFLLLVWHPFSAQYQKGILRIDFLDVGQGDSALVTMPNGTTLLVDGGGQPQFLNNATQRRQRSIGEMVVCEYLWYRGLDSIDYVLATHADADHIDGLNDVVANFKVRSALVARTPANDAEYQEFVESLKRTSTPIQIVQAGDVLHIGDVEAEVLWPPAMTALDAPSRNDDSIVIRLRYGERTFLLTGDIEKATEAFLSSADLVHADLVKVPHHGSRSSSSEQFVSAVRPRLAVISVGQRSIFGHPHAEVVERWHRIGAEVLTTGNSGTITVITDGRSLRVEKFVK